MRTQLMVLIAALMTTQIAAAANLLCISKTSDQALSIYPSSKTVRWGTSILSTRKVKLSNFTVRRCPNCFSGKGVVRKNGKTYKISFSTSFKNGPKINGFKQIARARVSASGIGSTNLKCIKAR